MPAHTHEENPCADENCDAAPPATAGAVAVELEAPPCTDLKCEESPGAVTEPDASQPSVFLVPPRTVEAGAGAKWNDDDSIRSVLAERVRLLLLSMPGWLSVVCTLLAWAGIGLLIYGMTCCAPWAQYTLGAFALGLASLAFRLRKEWLGENAPPPLFDDQEFKPLLLVASGGAFGGWLAMYLGLIDGATGPLPQILAGAVAATMGVFYFLRPDPKNRVHCLVLAIVCGMLGRPIIGKSLQEIENALGGPQRAAEQAVAEAKKSVSQELPQLSPNAGEAERKKVGAELREIAAPVVNGVEKLEQLKDTPLKERERADMAAVLGSNLPAWAAKAKDFPDPTLGVVESYVKLAKPDAKRDTTAYRIAQTLKEQPETKDRAEAILKTLDSRLRIKPVIRVVVPSATSPELRAKLQKGLESLGYTVESKPDEEVPADQAMLNYFATNEAGEAGDIARRFRVLGYPLSAEPALQGDGSEKTPRIFELRAGLNWLQKHDQPTPP